MSINRPLTDTPSNLTEQQVEDLLDLLSTAHAALGTAIRGVKQAEHKPPARLCCVCRARPAEIQEINSNLLFCEVCFFTLKQKDTGFYIPS